MTTENAFECLESLIAGGGSAVSERNRNEAQTRFDIIDKILTEVLDWPDHKIKLEENVDTAGFSDYELLDLSTVAIVEAKREGVSFHLPDDSPAGPCNLRAVLGGDQNKELKLALNQVSKYAGARGVGPCAVTNGLQWVLFMGSRADGTPPLEGRALMYRSLEDIKDRLLEFRQVFSPEGVAQKALGALLLERAGVVPAPLSSQITNYPGIRRRNDVQTTLQTLSSLLLEDIPEGEDYTESFLRSCYATNGALSSYLSLSKDLVTSRAASLLSESNATEVSAHTKRGVNPALSQDSITAAATHRPIVLLGGVGAGKSTFIKHLINVDAEETFRKSVTITVDFGRGAAFSSPANFAVERIYEDLITRHEIDISSEGFVEDVYKAEITRFESGPIKSLRDAAPAEYALKKYEFIENLTRDRSQHLKRSIERIVRSHRKQVIVFLDNVDQRSAETQNDVFLVAQEMASTWEATVFVALRPETYYDSLRYGAISGYHARVFTISPPRADVMLKKRVDFALQVLSGRGGVTSGDVSFQSENLETFLEVLSYNFKDNARILALIENMAGGNMRRALEIVTQFIGSGHVDTLKIIAAERREPGQYVIPVHELLRSVMHGDNEYYEPASSPVPNLFSVSSADSRDHFCVPILLGYLRSVASGARDAGYVEGSRLYGDLQALGYSQTSITFALNYAGRFRLVEGPSSDREIALASHLRLTTVGSYSLDTFPKLFTYIDAMIVNTPILDREIRESINDVMGIDARLDRASKFRRYLDGCWASVDPSVGEVWSWPGDSERLLSDIQRIERRRPRRGP